MHRLVTALATHEFGSVFFLADITLTINTSPSKMMFFLQLTTYSVKLK